MQKQPPSLEPNDENKAMPSSPNPTIKDAQTELQLAKNVLRDSEQGGVTLHVRQERTKAVREADTHLKRANHLSKGGRQDLSLYTRQGEYGGRGAANEATAGRP